MTDAKPTFAGLVQVISEEIPRLRRTLDAFEEWTEGVLENIRELEEIAAQEQSKRIDELLAWKRPQKEEADE